MIVYIRKYHCNSIGTIEVWEKDVIIGNKPKNKIIKSGVYGVKGIEYYAENEKPLYVPNLFLGEKWCNRDI